MGIFEGYFLVCNNILHNTYLNGCFQCDEMAKNALVNCAPVMAGNDTF